MTREQFREFYNLRWKDSSEAKEAAARLNAFCKQTVDNTMAEIAKMKTVKRR